MSSNYFENAMLCETLTDRQYMYADSGEQEQLLTLKLNK